MRALAPESIPAGVDALIVSTNIGERDATPTTALSDLIGARSINFMDSSGEMCAFEFPAEQVARMDMELRAIARA